MKRLGFDYETLSALNPKLIYAAISGFGHTGPFREKGAYDMVIQGYGGVMSITGNPDGEPVRVGYSVADLAAGLYGSIAITGALRVRDRLQKGQFLDVSMFDCQVALMENAVARYFATGNIPGPLGNRHPSIAPFQAFKSATGYFTVTASTDEQFGNLCDLMERPELKSDPRFLTKTDRAKNAQDVSDVFNQLFEGKSKEHWIELLEGRGIPCGPINNVREVVESPQVQAREWSSKWTIRRLGRSRWPALRSRLP